MRLIRLTFFAVLIVAGFAAVALSGLTRDLTRDGIAERVRAGISGAFDRPVFATRVDVTFADRLTVVLHNVAMARPTGRPSPALITADAIVVTLDPWSLLMGAIIVERVHVISPRLIAQGDLQVLAAWQPTATSRLSSKIPEITVSDGSGHIDIGLNGDYLSFVVDAASGRWRLGQQIEITMSGQVAETTPFAFDGTLSTGPEGAAFAARSLAIGDSVLTGTLIVEPRCDRPRVTATLVTEYVALDDWIDIIPLPDRPDLETVFGSTDRGAGFDVFEPLTTIDIDLDLTAARADLSGHVFQEAGLALSLANGRLAVTDLHARTDKGGFSLDAVFDRSEAAHHVSLRADGLALSSFSKNGKTARIDIDFSLSGRGLDWPTLLASLSGNARFDLVDAEMRVPKADLFDVVLPWVRETGRFTIERLRAALAIDEGRVVADDIRLDTPRVALAIEGTVDFRERSMHIELTPDAKDPDIADISVPLMISGPLDDPAVLPNPAHPSAQQ